jgi:putative serine protease PepD
VIIAILFVAGGYVVGRAANDNKATGQPAASAAPTTNGPSETAGTVAGNSEEPVEAVAAAVAPAVVQIETSTGLGSGVIYDSSGLIVTAAHVVEGETAVTIRLADGTALDGKVLGADPGTDIGVVQVKSDKALPAATLATGVAVQVGQLAVAIGSPFGLDQTVTSGVISAVDRAMPTLDGAIGMYQTDAPINPGNSGGALADRKGRVIGINDQIQTDNGGNVGVGFAIPIDVAAEVAQSIVSGTPLVHAFLGVQSSDAAGSEGGALIVQVQKGSPAEKAGLKRGDRIVAVDDSPIQSATDLVAKVRGAHAGDTMTFKIDRDGNTVTATVTLGSK